MKYQVIKAEASTVKKIAHFMNVNSIIKSNEIIYIFHKTKEI